MADESSVTDGQHFEQPEPTAAEGESKADAFKRLGNYRVQKLLERIRLLGNLSNRSTYEYTAEQIDKIEQAVNAEVAATMKRFRGGEKDKPLFTL